MTINLNPKLTNLAPDIVYVVLYLLDTFFTFFPPREPETKMWYSLMPCRQPRELWRRRRKKTKTNPLWLHPLYSHVAFRLLWRALVDQWVEFLLGFISAGMRVAGLLRFWAQ